MPTIPTMTLESFVVLAHTILLNEKARSAQNMSAELLILLGVCGYGAIQALVTGPIEPMRQVHRNFSETFYLFAVCILLLHALNAFGNWSLQSAVVYAAGRALYLVLSIQQLRPVRKWAWAVSIAGIVGCMGELARFLLTEGDGMRIIEKLLSAA